MKVGVIVYRYEIFIHSCHIKWTINSIVDTSKSWSNYWWRYTRQNRYGDTNFVCWGCCTIRSSTTGWYQFKSTQSYTTSSSRVPRYYLTWFEIQQNPINKTEITAGSNLGFRKALLRALAKNLLMALLFPFCFAMFFFRSNRTSYDIMTKTIVVEENPAPVFRRR